MFSANRDHTKSGGEIFGRVFRATFDTISGPVTIRSIPKRLLNINAEHFDRILIIFKRDFEFVQRAALHERDKMKSEQLKRNEATLQVDPAKTSLRRYA